jgi:hypothetical protein
VSLQVGIGKAVFGFDMIALLMEIVGTCFERVPVMLILNVLVDFIL